MSADKNAEFVPLTHPSESGNIDELIRGRVTLGDFEITVLTDGYFLMDGGAMFGVVPKMLWLKRAAPDPENRIVVGANTVVVRDGKQTVVIETGLGNKLDPKMRAFYGARQLLPSAFAAAGIGLDEVTVVVSSHLHFDHCGWNTTRGEDGSISPTFPNARYFAQQGEVEHGRLQLERDRVSYLADNYEPLIANGQMTLLDGAATIAPGISVEIHSGHTERMMTVCLDSGGQRGCFTGDLIPTSAHLDVTWAMAFDLDPLAVIEQRKRLYARAIPEDWLLFFPHDHHRPFCRVELDQRGKPVVAGNERKIL